MKFLIRVSIPTTEGNEMVKDPNFLKNMRTILKVQMPNQHILLFIKGTAQQFSQLMLPQQIKCQKFANPCVCWVEKCTGIW